MERFRAGRSPGSERFLGIFSPPGDSSSSAGVGVELDEDEVLWTNAAPGSPELVVPESSSGSRKPALSPTPSAAFRHTGDRSFGILAALPEKDGNRLPGSGGGVAPLGGQILQRKTSISSTSSSASNSPSSSFASTAARMIPSAPKTKPAEYSVSMPAAGRVHQPQSAPVNVPAAARRGRRGIDDGEDDVMDETDRGNCDEEEMLPPHEIVARTYARSQTGTFSVLEGAGRTLKGRDLRRVRNAVLRQTGFLD